MSLKALQVLARNNNSQLLYRNAKELGTLRLFNNDTDLSQIQITYLYYLSLYEMLYTDLQMQEEYLSEEVINDELRCEAYLLFKKVNRKKKTNSQHLPTHTGGAGSLIFKRGKGK
jgi:hypothetical protein